MSKIDVNNQDYYEYNKPEKKDRTMQRLSQMNEIGMEETGVASFGIPGIMSGLYIEMVWSHSDEEFDDYLDWVKELRNGK